jgi:hypothetical protein
MSQLIVTAQVAIEPDHYPAPFDDCLVLDHLGCGRSRCRLLLLVGAGVRRLWLPVACHGAAADACVDVHPGSWVTVRGDLQVDRFHRLDEVARQMGDVELAGCVVESDPEPSGPRWYLAATYVGVADRWALWPREFEAEFEFLHGAFLAHAATTVEVHPCADGVVIAKIDGCRCARRRCWCLRYLATPSGTLYRLPWKCATADKFLRRYRTDEQRAPFRVWPDDRTGQPGATVQAATAEADRGGVTPELYDDR